MKLDLAYILKKSEKFEKDETICPIMSRFDVSQGALQREPDLLSFTVVCVGKMCGMYNNCHNVKADS